MGPRPARVATKAGGRLLLVHGYCSSDVWGPVSGQFTNDSVFLDLNQNRSHDTFAVLVGIFGSAYSSFGIVAHSQSGAAALHLYTYYWSGLDFASGGRLIHLGRLDVQAGRAYNAGMQYTLRNIPPDVDQALRQEAHEQHKSLNQVAVETLQRSVGRPQEARKRRDLTDIAGTWQEDSQFDAALEDQDRIDPEMWS